MSELLTTIVQYNECYYDTYYNHNHLYYHCMLSISCKSSTICSSSGILIVNSDENVLLIEFALVEGMPELLLVSYKEYDQCYNKYNVTCKGRIGEYD